MYDNVWRLKPDITWSMVYYILTNNKLIYLPPKIGGAWIIGTSQDFIYDHPEAALAVYLEVKDPEECQKKLQERVSAFVSKWNLRGDLTWLMPHYFGHLIELNFIDREPNLRDFMYISLKKGGVGWTRTLS